MLKRDEKNSEMKSIEEFCERGQNMRFIKDSDDRLDKLFTGAVIALVLVSILFLTTSVDRRISSIEKVDIRVSLDEWGDAHIRQVWKVSEMRKSQFCISIPTAETMRVENFRVSMESKEEFLNTGIWNSDQHVDKKLKTCGTQKDKGETRLYWGIDTVMTDKQRQDGIWNRGVYIVDYTLRFAMRSHSNFDAMVLQFKNQIPSSLIKEIEMHIEKRGSPFQRSKAKLVCAGVGTSQREEDGEIIVESTESIAENDELRLLFLSNKGSFYPSRKSWKNEGILHLELWTGMSWNELVSLMLKILAGLVLWIILRVVLVILKNFVRYHKDKLYLQEGLEFPNYDEISYHTKIPCDGNIAAIVNGLSKFDIVSEEHILSAYILKFIKVGAMKFQKVSDLNPWSDSERYVLVMVSDGMLQSPVERKLYEIMVASSGFDNVLQEAEFRRWTKIYCEEFRYWLESVFRAGEKYFSLQGASRVIYKERFWGWMRYKEETVYALGLKLISEIMGFYKYLKDFTLIYERAVQEVELWDEYLIIAALCGMSSEVFLQMRKLYPEFSDSYSMPALNWSLIREMKASVMEEVIQPISASALEGMEDGIKAHKGWRRLYGTLYGNFKGHQRNGDE